MRARQLTFASAFMVSERLSPPTTHKCVASIFSVLFLREGERRKKGEEKE